LKQSDDWTFDIDNDFAEQLCNISLPPTLTNQSRVLDDCDCCTTLFDLSEGNASYSSAFFNRPYEIYARLPKPASSASLFFRPLHLITTVLAKIWNFIGTEQRYGWDMMARVY
jgi:hypothetical protein